MWNTEIFIFIHEIYTYIFIYKIQKILSYMKYAPVCSYMKYRNIDLGLISVSESSPGEGNVYPLQYFCLENSLDRGAWRTTLAPCEESYDQPRQCFQKQRHRFADKGLRSQREQPRQGSRLITGATWMETGGGVHVQSEATSTTGSRIWCTVQPQKRKGTRSLQEKGGRQGDPVSHDVTSGVIWKCIQMKAFQKETQPQRLRRETSSHQECKMWAGRYELLQTNICT